MIKDMTPLYAVLSLQFQFDKVNKWVYILYFLYLKEIKDYTLYSLIPL